MEVLKNFLSPKVIAIIGASQKEGKVGFSLMKNLDEFKGEVIPINPNSKFILGKKAYGNVLDYPGKIDLAVIAVKSESVPSVLEDCGKKKIYSVIIISSGFSETGNKKGEEKILRIAKRYKIRILGPNCFGVSNPYLNFDTTFSLNKPSRGNIAFISQSGALFSYISDITDFGFGISGFVSLGNMSDLSFCDFIEYFLKDGKTKAIVLYIEKLKDGRKFIDICKRSKKKIYAVKAGKSQKGSEASISHTGSLATDFNVYKGAFKQAKVTLCNSLVECFEKASGKKLGLHKKLRLGKRAVIITNAGGAGALFTDYCESHNVKVVEWEEKNPYDLLGTARSEDYRKAMDKLKNRRFYDSIIVIMTPQKMTDIEKTAYAISEFKNETSKSIIALFLGKKSMKKANEIFKDNSVQYSNTMGLY